MHTMTFEL